MSEWSTIELPGNFAGFAFVNQYARLPERFYARVNPTPVGAPSLIKLNHALAEELGLDAAALEQPEGVAMLAGNAVPPGAEPLAQAYAGHQFGHLNPRLGDGRAILLGEVVDRDGRAKDIQLKGAGRTPFSRGGDGRSALGPVLREYIVSEAMHALGIKTTRALAAVLTGEQVYRDTALPGAILARVASSHVRIGTFEYLRQRNDKEGIKLLADFVIDRHYPQIREQAPANPYLALLDGIIDAKAALVASWLRVGFIHGVMNTDNTSVSGETIDYGPCAFMDRYDPATVFSSIDRQGRYAYINQSNIALWNLSRLAECLLHLIDDDQQRAIDKAEHHLSAFGDIIRSYWLDGMCRKLGLTTAGDGDRPLVESWLSLLEQHEVDFTLGFRRLTDYLAASDSAEDALRNVFGKGSSALDNWLTLWRQRLSREQQSREALAQIMAAANPVYIPRNHRIEAVITAAVEQGDFKPMHEMVDVLSNPYAEQPGRELYAQPPAPSERVYQTFCGT